MKVTIVGSGVIGLACAWELHRGGAEVTVLERGAIGGGASLGNTGWIVPSMTSPLPAPGMVREGIRQLVTRGDAFVLRPSLDPSFVRWLWRFWRSSTPTRFDAGIEALLALNRRTLEHFDAYREAGLDFEMVESGLLVVARTKAGLEHYRDIFARLRSLGYEGSEPLELDGAAVAELEPAVDSSNVAAGLHARVDRYIRPESLTRALADRLRDDGVEVVESAAVDALRREDGGWTIATAEDDRRADAVVVAAGLAASELLQPLGVRLAMQPARGYSVTVSGEGTPPRHALYLAEARIGLSPYEGGVRVAGVFELGASRAEAPSDAGARLLAATRPYLAGWRPDTNASPSTWAGLRPATADGLPLIGAIPGHDGLFVATGHGMLGVTLAPATAAVLAPLVLEGRELPELRPFAPGRR